MTALASASAPAYSSPPTFSAIIEQDHNNINKYAGRLKKARTAADRGRLLLEVTWRLVRHDVSEDIVMRPAFIQQLGDEGREMAEHDRTDHDHARLELLALFDLSLESDGFPSVIDKLFAELLEHMKVESGEQIPRLEGMLDLFESQRLGREYLRTQILTPDLEYLDSEGVGRRMWRDVEDYARTELARFREIWEDFLAGRLRLLADTSGVRVPVAKGKL
ncbi:uncharacterized protein A1O9_04954 [Exophiala aquamarina CBS 119918]|uniref:Hemerythrin-like domain-containing protein n=1 Tax=Exophiala aquamarina CBS 119918 TaxID=1182545 RepID=A0A072PIZ2_9EURO|nr:uncharacterized protein A1O9_04954 [Exophiala aquamarina CBS 119918]KEF60104.1 hypothetical protein A1O9_04954 [Exophiala aquamarina CBS 119918]